MLEKLIEYFTLLATTFAIIIVLSQSQTSSEPMIFHKIIVPKKA